MGLFDVIFGKKIAEAPLKVERFPSLVSTNFVNADIPPLQGDYTRAIFLYAHQKSSPVKTDNEYQQYFLYECGVRNPSKYHRELITEGYLEKSSPKERINSLKIPELKTILTELGKATSGKKDDLIQRIFDNANEEIMIKWCPGDLYSISIKGREFLENNMDYVKIHQHKNWDISWKEYNSRKKPGLSFYDVAWDILNEKVSHSPNYGRSEYLSMYQLLAEEGKKKEALENLLRVLYNDLSGVDGFNTYSLYKNRMYTKKEVIDAFDLVFMFAPGITGPIGDYRDFYSDDIVDCIYNTYKLPVQLCEKKLFLEIVHSLMDNTYDEDKIKQKLKVKYRQFIESLSR